MPLYKCTIQYLPYGERSPGQKSHSSAVQLREKKVSEKQGMYFLVLFLRMRSSFPIISFCNWEAGRGDYSWGLFFFLVGRWL